MNEHGKIAPSRATASAGVASRAALAFVIFAALALGVGCKPKIGDKCSISTDCSITGDRLCDTTQPGGYCTIFNCEPNSCPSDEAICVAFDSFVCGDPQRSPRFVRSFCMAQCSSDGDCRSGYACLDPAVVNGQIIDTTPPTPTACMVPASMPGGLVSPDAGYDGPTVCDPGDAMAWDGWPAGDATSGGDASADAADDADAADLGDATDEADSADAPGTNDAGTD